VRVYERAAFHRCLAEPEAERDRLKSSVGSAQEGRETPDRAQPISETERLGRIVLDAQAQLVLEWDECRQHEVALEEATEAIAAWIVAAAHSYARSLRAVAGGIQAPGAGEAGEIAESWWQSVIDLTAGDTSQSAQPA
jgi:hypothetical protein